MEQLVFGSGGVYQNDTFHACCSNAMWPIGCQGGAQGMSYYTQVWGFDPRFMTAQRIIDKAYSPNMGLQATMTGPYGEGPGEHPLASPNNPDYDGSLIGTGWCNDGFQPNYSAMFEPSPMITQMIEDMGSPGTGIYESKGKSIKTRLKERLQKLAGIKK